MPEENTTPEGLTLGEDGVLNDAQKDFINQNFRAAMNEEHGTHATLADYKDLDGWAKSTISREKIIGNPNTVALPNSKSEMKEWREFNSKLGLPAEAKDYNIKAHEGATDEDIEWFKNLAHSDKVQLTERQARALWDSFNERNSQVRSDYSTKQQNRLNEGMKDLESEIGPNFKAVVSATNKGLERMDPDGRFRKFMKSSGLNQEPEMLRFAIKVAEMFNEDRTQGDERGAMPMTAQQAEGKYKKAMSEIMKDPDHPYMNKKDPMHEDWIKKMDNWAFIAAGGKK